MEISLVLGQGVGKCSGCFQYTTIWRPIGIWRYVLFGILGNQEGDFILVKIFHKSSGYYYLLFAAVRMLPI